MPISTDVLHLHPSDNVAVATTSLPAGHIVTLAARTLRLSQSVPLGHKLAVESMPSDAQVTKYGQPIGVSTQSIAAGDWVHSHNLRNDDQVREYQWSCHVPPATKADTVRTFQGYRRADGRVGTRNYIAVISNVNCSATVSKQVAQHFQGDELANYPHVDGVIALTHHGGCAMQFGGQQHQLLNRVMGGMARHPNIAAYLLIGLGCEQATLDYLVEDQRLVQIEGVDGDRRPPVLTMQQAGGTRQTLARAVDHVRQLLPIADRVRREPVPISELILGTQCGGSDGSSGITANPAVGVASDMIVSHGGTVILGETPEVIGAEHLLTQRAVSEAVGRKLIDRIQWWRWYANIFGEFVDNNRSAGNAAGGLTTIAEKSLGAVAKAGSTALVDVYQYADPVTAKGLVLMDTPGFDPCSLTGMVAGGANLIVFTTGRGSCYGCKPTPSLKIATNTPMYEHMQDDMDIDAGRILSGSSVAEIGHEIFEKLLAVASGERTRSERHGFGDEEFVPWMIGPVL